MEFASEEYLARYRELRKIPKHQLAAEYVRLSGWVGGMHHPRTWQKDELIRGVIESESRNSDHARERETIAALSAELRTLRGAR